MADLHALLIATIVLSVLVAVLAGLLAWQWSTNSGNGGTTTGVKNIAGVRK